MPTTKRRGSTHAAASAAAFVIVSLLAACTRRPIVAAPARIELNTDTIWASVDVLDLPVDMMRELSRPRSKEEWAAILRVSVARDQPPMVGEWKLVEKRLRFTPMFPLDLGRPYTVVFTPPPLPEGADGADGVEQTTIVSLPEREKTATTVVSQVYPMAETLPENQLRLYVCFSAPMGLKGGLDYVHLIDEDGREVKDPFLPLDADFWNDDRTRFTVFFDPGRVKSGVQPNEELGRSLIAGHRYTFVVDPAWPDGSGLPLKEVYRRTFVVRAADSTPLDPKTWRFTTPASGTRDPLIVEFPEPLDHGLMQRSLGVETVQGLELVGQIAIPSGEERWSWTPRDPWRTGSYRLVAYSMLEDLAGNRIGRAFEVDQFSRSDSSSEPEKTTVPFQVR